MLSYYPVPAPKVRRLGEAGLIAAVVGNEGTGLLPFVAFIHIFHASEGQVVSNGPSLGAHSGFKLFWNWALRVQIYLAGENEFSRILSFPADASLKSDLGLGPFQYFRYAVERESFRALDARHFRDEERYAFSVRVEI